MNEWIDVEDERPEKNQTVRVKTEGREKPRFATYCPKEYRDGWLESLGYAWVFEDCVPGTDLCRITHWMPLEEENK